LRKVKRVQHSVEKSSIRLDLLFIKQNIERIIQTYGRNRTYVLFGKDKEMKEIIEGILKELRVKYITENEVKKIVSTNVVLYWNVEDREKLEGLKCKFLMSRI